MRHCSRFLSKCIALCRVFDGESPDDELSDGEALPEVSFEYEKSEADWTAVRNPRPPKSAHISALGSFKLPNIDG